jgi:uncharacterized 2Fe-2S/4Fe-4S cluster protein (DUF4445 family)
MGFGNLLGQSRVNDRTHTLTVHVDNRTTRLIVGPGLSVREALDATALRVRAACGGIGSCGACVVRLLSGDVNLATTAEHMKLSADELAQGLRLACQLRLQGDAEVLVEDAAQPSVWKSIAPEDLLPVDARMPELEQHIYGVAVDLGTSHIRVALWDRKHGRRIATRRGPNPQSVFGADVLNRLDAARAGPQRAHELAALARGAIIDAVRDMLARDVGEVTPMLAEIGEVAVAGNTAMLALLTGRGGDALLDPENWQRPVDCSPDDDAAWHAGWHMPNARIEVLAPAAGFVGSDLLADVLATGLTEGPAGAMLLDVGTNIEIALWDGERLHVTSVPGGPAFEGGGVRHGMAAEHGAICNVARRPAGDGFELKVIGGGEARGLCGSGLIDAVAVLLRTGILKASGRFAVDCGAKGFLLDPADSRSAITGTAIDTFQRAKAAAASAMAVLLSQAGMGWEGIGRLCLCGAFGRTLDVGNAQAVGLLPPVPSAAVELYADATLAGCEMALLSPGAKTRLTHIARSLTLVNVSLVIEFEDRYIEELRLRPIAVAQ